VSPFEPLDGSVARWRTVHDHLRTLTVGDVLTYKWLSDRFQVSDRHVLQSVVRRAAKEFEKTDKHALVAVPNVGYRVVRPEEHATLARVHQAKSSRSLVRGHSKVINVDYNDMTPEGRALAEAMASSFSRQMDFNRRFDVRQRNLEKAVEAVTVKTERTDAQVQELEERLARLENRSG
jgi:hypothetical protein